MATGISPDINPRELLPSEKREVQLAAHYAKDRKEELEHFKGKVQNMGPVRLFLDSRVPRTERGFLRINLRPSNREEIKEEIKRYLEFYDSMIAATDKIEDENKTAEEKETPFNIMMKLNEELSYLFDLAESGKNSTTSRAISKLYKEFLDKKAKLENKVKMMECVFLRQQLLAESVKVAAHRSHVKKNTDDMKECKKKMYNEMVDEAEYLKESNKELQNLIKEANEKIEFFEKNAKLLTAEKFLTE